MAAAAPRPVQSAAAPRPLFQTTWTTRPVACDTTPSVLQSPVPGAPTPPVSPLLEALAGAPPPPPAAPLPEQGGLTFVDEGGGPVLIYPVGILPGIVGGGPIFPGLVTPPDTGGGGPPVVVIPLTPVLGPVPEPSAWALLILGFGGVGALVRRRRRAQLSSTH